MNLFKRFLELVPGEAPLLVGTVIAVSATTTTLQALGGSVVVVRGGEVTVGQRAFYQAGAIVGPAPDLPTYDIEV